MAFEQSFQRFAKKMCVHVYMKGTPILHASPIFPSLLSRQLYFHKEVAGVQGVLHFLFLVSTVRGGVIVLSIFNLLLLFVRCTLITNILLRMENVFFVISR